MSTTAGQGGDGVGGGRRRVAYLTPPGGRLRRTGSDDGWEETLVPRAEGFIEWTRVLHCHGTGGLNWVGQENLCHFC